MYQKVFHISTIYGQREISNYVSGSIKRGVDGKTNSFEITYSKPISFIKEDDFIVFYLSKSPIVTLSDENIYMYGQVQQITPKMSNGKFSYNIKGWDYSRVILSTSVSLVIREQDGLLWNEALIKFSKLATLSSSGNGSSTLTFNNIATTKLDGSAFSKKVAYSSNFKKLSEIYSDLIQPEYTGDTKTYKYYVDKNSDVHIFHPDNYDVVDDSIIVNFGDGTLDDYEPTFDQSNKIGVLYADCGKNMYNSTVWEYGTNPYAAASQGSKPITLHSICKDLLRIEINAGNIIKQTDGVYTIDGESYTYKEFPFTTTWGLSVSDEGSYLQEFNGYARSRAKTKMNKIFATMGKGLWSLRATVKWTYLNPGDIVTFNLQKLNTSINGLRLRVDDINYSLGAKPGIQLTFKQDEEVVVE